MELLSELECVDDLWVSEPHDEVYFQVALTSICLTISPRNLQAKYSYVNRKRFNRYAGYVRSIDHCELDLNRGHRGHPSDQVMKDTFYSTTTSSGSVFPNLTRTVTSLQISFRGPSDAACIEVLRGPAHRNILLTELYIAMREHRKIFVEELPDVLANRKRSIRVGLPYYSASR
ncbi:hypothetical protein FRB97_004277 [Tulasnella sp. 331]|nr:hypothetical protein FRB97_004277 [Tulasnella sp. 331]